MKLKEKKGDNTRDREDCVEERKGRTCRLTPLVEVKEEEPARRSVLWTEST